MAEENVQRGLGSEILPTLGGVGGFAVGGPIGGGVGAAAGEFAQQKLEQAVGKRQEIDPFTIGATGVLNAIPFERALAPVARKVAPAFANALQKSTLRLTPVQKQNLGSTIDNVTNWLSTKRIIGTPEGRFSAVNKIYNGFEDTLQNFLKKETKGITADRDVVIKEIDALKAKYADDRDLPVINRQIDKLKQQIKFQFPDKIPLDRLNVFKRTTYKNAYNKAGSKVIDSVEHDVGDVLRKRLESTLGDRTIGGRSLGEFNKEYSTAIQARRLLHIAKSRPQIGSIERLIIGIAGTGAGLELGGFGGAATGGLLSEKFGEQVLGTAPKSVLAAFAQAGIKATPKQIGILTRILFPEVTYP